MKKLTLAFVLFSLFAVFVSACGDSSGNNSSSNGTDVHMGAATFTQPSVTIKKGSSINLIDDVAVVHIIQNGTWDSNNVARPATEPGAPKVNALQFNGNDNQPVGPFNTAGTYHLYCTVHPGMNLTVIVQ
jgi:plastocyanin